MFNDLRPIDVFAAARNVRGVVQRTELRRSRGLSERVGRDVFLKLESEQVTGSFKLRGAYNAIAMLDDTVRARGVVASSAGNHGLGVAFAARQFGIPATIFIPASAPEVKRRGIQALGATVDATAPSYDDAMTLAKAFARERGATFINPCLGDTLVAGQGTVALEIIEELPELAQIVVPVGGAGLLAGVASLLRHLAPHVRISGVQSVNTAAMARALQAAQVVPIPNVPTLADGLAGAIDDFALDVGRHALDDMATVSEEAIARAIAWLAHEEELTVEGSGAVGVAALLEGALPDLRSPMAVVLTGRNIDPDRHAGVLREGRS
ncbi:MAG TPA: threonine/serine dehydratase [Gemmatimonadaceae bacterium]|nr:threonine/serine dehydratase [Gemmatimonadaceae bacterium]